MSSFTTRVELHYATESDYTTLHQAMEAEGFSRIIQGRDGVWYHLPTAEYVKSGSLTIETVRESAQRAAARTGRGHAVFVTKGDEWAWVGLARVQQNAYAR